MKKAPPNPVPEHAKDAFDYYIKLWQERLGLMDWRIERSLKKPAKRNMAEMLSYLPDRLATYRLADDFGSLPVNERTVEELALHELLHTFLCEVVDQVYYGVDGDALVSAEHRVINTLVKLLTEAR